MITQAEEYYTAKYHYSVAERMLKAYEQFPEKRFITGAITELAKATSKLIRAYLLHHNKKTLEEFKKITIPTLKAHEQQELLTILDIEKTQKTTPVQFNKEDKIIMLDQGTYKVLTIPRLKTLQQTLQKAINKYPKTFRQL